MAKEEINASANSEKLKALQAAMLKIEKDFGKGSIMKMGDEQIEEVEVIPTGSIALNAALGVGGYPKGRIIEIYGPESSGKTTLAIHAIAEAQKAGGIAAFIDAEHALDPTYAKALGVDVDNMYILKPQSQSAEDIFQMLLDMIEKVVERADIFEMRCRNEFAAAEMSYNAMKGKGF